MAEMESRPHRTIVVLVALVLTALGAYLQTDSHQYLKRSNGVAEMVSSDSSSESPYKLSVASVDYDEVDLELYPWSHVAEPHKTSQLSVDVPRGMARSINWVIARLDESTDGTESSVGLRTVEQTKAESMGTIEFNFRSVAKTYRVTAKVTLTTGQVHTVQEDVVCKYVRREIRRLSEQDLHKFLSATEKFHRLSVTEGRALYGDKWTNYEEITTKHLGYMTKDKCTAFHGHNTFLPAHEAFTMEFEQALQAIDPSISCPYWDWTMDEPVYHTSWRESSVLSHEMFGVIDNSANGNVLSSKYFTDLPISQSEGFAERNAYNLQTDSINLNPSTKVTRSASICGLETKTNLAGCTALKGALTAKTLDTLRANLENVVHAQVHMAIGGATDCGQNLNDAVSQFGRAELFEGIGLLSNTIWRSMQFAGVMDCPTSCEEGETCACGCPSFDFEDESLNAKHELNQNGIIQMLSSQIDTSSYISYTPDTNEPILHDSTHEEDSAFWKFLLQYSCEPGHMGQFGTPLAATNDPVFWPSHSSWGRMWAFTRLSPALKSQIDTTWINEPEDCNGMLNWDDEVPFKGFLDEEDAKPYTNHELYNLFDPANPELTYVFDDLKWSHCSE